MNKKDEKRIRDIVAEAQRALGFAQGKTKADLETDTMLAYAVTHCLLIIGEAAIQGIRRNAPTLPTDRMAKYGRYAQSNCS